MRRFLLVVAVWLGLVGMAEPLLACAMNTPAASCCSADTQAPCEHHSGHGIGAGDRGLCCATAPVGQPLSVSTKQSDAKPLYETSGNSDVPLAVTSSDQATASIPRYTFRFQPSASGQRFGAETYLRTGRLRL